jgi:hypothetical protein
MHDLTRAAISYLAAGHHLLALTGKRPNTKYHQGWDWDRSIHGLPESAEDEDRLNDIFADKTTTGVAILIPENVLVADIDTEAAASLFQSMSDEVPNTQTGKTPNGLHLWFLAPGANGSQWLGDRTLLFKGYGGYVVAPPSAHFNEYGQQDGVYEWIGGWGVIDWLPEKIDERLKAQRALTATEPVKTSEGGAFLFVPTDEDGRWTGQGWGAWHIEGLCRAIIDAPEGNQNNMIAWAAMQARDEGVPFPTAMTQLLAAALEGNHPKHRAEATIRGAYKRVRRG